MLSLEKIRRRQEAWLLARTTCLKLSQVSSLANEVVPSSQGHESVTRLNSIDMPC